MQVPWEALAEAFLYNVRRLIEDVCAARVAEGRLLPEEAARHRESPAVYRIVLEGLRMGTLTTASDRERFLDPAPDDVASLERLLADPERMHFVRCVAREAGGVPDALIFAFVRGAVYTVCPSVNRDWIEVAAAVHPVGVRDTLWWFLERGTPFEAAGALNAWYWFDVDVNSSPRARELHDTEAVFTERFRRVCLTRFVETDDEQLARSLVFWVRWDTDSYPPELHPLLERARAKASEHPDEYVRHRYRMESWRSHSSRVRRT